jgi:acetyl esterase/lipase
VRGRVLGAATSATLLPLLRDGNAAPRTRRRIELLGRLIRSVPRGTRFHAGVLGGVPVHTVLPRTVTSRNCIVYLHGGAYVSGSPRAYRGLVSHLASATGCRVVAVDYRLAPECPYPAGLEDSVAVYRALLAEGQDPAQLFIAGDSAGGGLTLATALSLRDGGLPLPAALMCIAPWTDLTGSGESMRTRRHRERMLTPAGIDKNARDYAGAESRTHPLISPLFADLSGLPPTMIQVGDDELLLDDSLRVAAAASHHDVDVTLQVWPDLWHVWHLYAGLMPEANAAIRQLADFVAHRAGRR